MENLENGLSLFQNNEMGIKVRSMLIEDKPYFIASDIAKALGYKNTSLTISKHCRSISKQYIPHPQNKNKTIEVSLIPEGDVYRLIIRSKLPSAEKFESWVMDEVLPQIRQTGGYIPIEKDAADAEVILRAMNILQTTIAKKDVLLEAQKTEIEKQSIEIETQTPKVEVYDKIMSSKDCLLIGDFAKLLGVIGGIELFRFLREKRILLASKKNWNIPAQKYLKAGYFIVKESFYFVNGKIHLSKTPHITTKGQAYITRRFFSNIEKEAND